MGKGSDNLPGIVDWNLDGGYRSVGINQRVLPNFQSWGRELRLSVVERATLAQRVGESRRGFRFPLSRYGCRSFRRSRALSSTIRSYGCNRIVVGSARSHIHIGISSSCYRGGIERCCALSSRGCTAINVIACYIRGGACQPGEHDVVASPHRTYLLFEGCRQHCRTH